MCGCAQLVGAYALGSQPKFAFKRKLQAERPTFWSGLDGIFPSELPPNAQRYYLEPEARHKVILTISSRPTLFDPFQLKTPLFNVPRHGDHALVVAKCAVFSRVG